MRKRVILRLVFLGVPFIGAGCCGIATEPNVPQTTGWMTEGAPSGTTVEAASAYWQAKGFTVAEHRTPSGRRELEADRRAGICLLGFNSDFIVVRSDVDETGNILSTDVTHETRPGL